MVQAQSHRGPDDEGIYVVSCGSDTVALGHRRLAIIDLSALGHQPMVNPDTGDVLVFNGEIYNFTELRDELVRYGLTFRGHSDTEVILRAYERWDTDCLARLKGMFALGLWDFHKRRLLLARDHTGMKPLYLARLSGGGAIFASELKALRASGLLDENLDLRAVAGFLAYGAVQEPLTIFRGARAVPPASWLQLNSCGEETAAGRHFQIPLPSPGQSRRKLNELVEQGKSILQKAVKRHLISDVPIGMFLSAGLDSTGILGIACKVASAKLNAFTVVVHDRASNEGPIARQTAARLGAVYHECPISLEAAPGYAEKALGSMDQPALDGLNTYIISREVRKQGIVVALSGLGGDELFGGYRAFSLIPKWNRWLRLFQSIPVPLRSPLLKLATADMASSTRSKAEDIVRASRTIADLYFQHRRLLSDRMMAALGINPTALQLTSSFQLGGEEIARCIVPGDAVASISRLEAVFYMRNVLLRDSDVFGMANSLEIRLPLLDREFMHWAYGLPGSVLLPRGNADKFLLRKLCGEFYTVEQTGRAKTGFTLPYAQWLLVGPLRDLMEESLDSLKRSGVVRASGVDQTRASFLAEPQSSAWSRVWALAILGHWLGITKLSRPPVSTAL
jgi:asparagine synthase (glutamine-hydrolysing)